MRWLLLVLALSAADAAQVKLTRAQLCAVSSLVVVAEVTSEEVRWSADKSGGIETVDWLAAQQVVRGGPPGDLQLVLPGGRIGDIHQWVEDVPDLEVDASYLLFLAPSPGGFVIVGGEQGAVRVGDGFEEREAAIASIGTCA